MEPARCLLPSKTAPGAASSEEGRELGLCRETPEASLSPAAGEMALSEIDYRRRGLYVSLFAIGLLAVGIWFKIRELDRNLPPA